MTCTPERIRLGFGEALGREWEKVLYFLTGDSGIMPIFAVNIQVNI